MRVLKVRQYEIGELIGSSGISFISEIEPRIDNKARIRYAKFRCHCGNEFEGKLSSIKTGHTTSCGCVKLKIFLNHITSHGMYKTSTYRVWDCIRERTGNPNTPDYCNYGGRGIMMFPPWIHDFQLFYDYVSALPNYGETGLTLDRTNNNGNYEPGNLRWTTRHIQGTNDRMQKNNTSGYEGVVWYKRRWVAQLVFMGKNNYLGRYKTKEQAVTVRNNYIITNKLFEYKVQPVKNHKQ
jgi:hypothetical protein